jgi:hypothetical protein
MRHVGLDVHPHRPLDLGAEDLVLGFQVLDLAVKVVPTRPGQTRSRRRKGLAGMGGCILSTDGDPGRHLVARSPRRAGSPIPRSRSVNQRPPVLDAAAG